MASFDEHHNAGKLDHSRYSEFIRKVVDFFEPDGEINNIRKGSHGQHAKSTHRSVPELVCDFIFRLQDSIMLLKKDVPIHP